MGWIVKKSLSILLIAAATLIFIGCRTPLVEAVLRDQSETVRTLIDKGADVNQKDADEFTPLHWAAYYDKSEMVKLLLSKGAQINSRSMIYGTPLIIAAQYGFIQTIKALLDYGADVHLTDGYGRTALNYAEEGNFLVAAQLLKDRGAAPYSTGARTAASSGRAGKADVTPGSGEPEKTAKATASRVAPKVKISVFHFTPLSMEASHYGITATNTLNTALRTEPSFITLDRKDLETFLAINDLRQDDRTENVLNIGTRLGLNFVIAGNIEKRGSLIITNCKVVSIDQGKVIVLKQSRSLGEASLISDMKKLGDDIAEAILGSHS